MSTERETAIRVSGLAKHYGPIRAVERIDLDVRRGEIYGFLGRNGAGKTTTIRAMLGLVHPSAGDVTILGHSVRTARRQALQALGFLVESATAYPNLTVHENLEIQRRLTGSGRGSVDRVIALLGLEPYAKRRADHLSLGNKQRLSLARALVHRPKVVILDEPANGLDPAGILEIRNLLRSLADGEGVTVFMSSHILAEVGQVADRVAIIHRGRVVEELDRGAMGSRRRLGIELKTNDDQQVARLLGEKLGYRQLALEPDGGLKVGDELATASEIARLVVQSGFTLNHLVTVEEDLEARFMRLTGGEK